MRKRIICLLSLVLVVSLNMLPACSSYSEQAVTSETAVESINNESLIVPIFNQLYYYQGLLYYIKQPLGTPAQLYYIDPESGENGLLCSKPDCTHDSDNCNACIDSTGDGFTVYRDKIYWLSSSIIERKLYCENLDGTNRREVMSLDKESEWFTGNKPFIEIYNDTLYRCGSGSVVKGGKAMQNMLLYSQPLQKGSKPQTIYSEEDIYKVVARLYEDQIFFAVIGNEYDLTIYVCRLNSGEVQELFHKDKADNVPNDIAVYDNKLILHGAGPCVSIYSLTDGSYNVVGEAGRDYYCATGTNIYELVSQNEYRLYSISGDLITEGNVDPPGFNEENYTQQYLGSIKETMLFLYSVSFASEKMPGVAALHNYLVAFNTDTLEWKILWDGISDYE